MTPKKPHQGDVRADSTVFPSAIIPPLPNYTLSTVCPACSAPIFRLACKVRCSRCGFIWDCSEL